MNALLAQGATARPARDPGRLARSTTGCATPAATPRSPPGVNGTEPSLDPFIPRRGDGLMLSASDIETYRLCPLKYKFARVFRIPQESTIHQRFGIALHQVLERFHQYGRGTARGAVRPVRVVVAARRLRRLRRRAAVPRARAGRARAATGSAAATTRASRSGSSAASRSSSGDHVLRGRVDRVDRRPDGSYELIDYKTGKATHRGAAARGRPAVALPDGRARVVGRARPRRRATCT